MRNFTKLRELFSSTWLKLPVTTMSVIQHIFWAPENLPLLICHSWNLLKLDRNKTKENKNKQTKNFLGPQNIICCQTGIMYHS